MNPKYLNTNSTGKKGIVFVESIIVKNNSIFQKIDADNDLGIDAIVEVIIDEKPISKYFAIQIKSGNSYYREKNNIVEFQVGNHREYWSNYPIPVVGIVYIPQLQKAYWINIKKYLTQNLDEKKVKINCETAHEFSDKYFSNIFLPLILNRIPELDFDESLNFFNSDYEFDSFIGLRSLAFFHSNKIELWSSLKKIITSKNKENISYRFMITFLGIACMTNEEFQFRMKRQGHSFSSIDFWQEFRAKLDYNNCLETVSYLSNQEVIGIISYIEDHGHTDMACKNGIYILPILRNVKNIKSIVSQIIYENKIDFNLKLKASVIYFKLFGKILPDGSSVFVHPKYNF